MLEKPQKGEKYVSCIKINGVPILPPVITSVKRKELSKYKHQAVKLEKRLKRERELREYITRYYLPKLDDVNVISESLEHNLAFLDANNISRSDESINRSQNKVQLRLCRDLQVSQYANSEFKVITNFENPTSCIGNVVENNSETTSSQKQRNSSDISENEDSPKPRVIRSNSYTLESPSPMLLQHLKNQREKGFDRSTKNEIATSTPYSEESENINLSTSNLISEVQSQINLQQQVNNNFNQNTTNEIAINTPKNTVMSEITNSTKPHSSSDTKYDPNLIVFNQQKNNQQQINSNFNENPTIGIVINTLNNAEILDKTNSTKSRSSSETEYDPNLIVLYSQKNNRQSNYHFNQNPSNKIAINTPYNGKILEKTKSCSSSETEYDSNLSDLYSQQNNQKYNIDKIPSNEETLEKLNSTKSDFMSESESELRNISDRSMQEDITVLSRDKDYRSISRNDNLRRESLDYRNLENISSNPSMEEDVTVLLRGNENQTISRNDNLNQDPYDPVISSVKDLSLDPDDRDKLASILNAIPESYSRQILELLERQKREQTVRMNSYMKIKETFLAMGNVPRIVDPPINANVQIERTVYYTPEPYLSPERQEKNNALHNMEIMNTNNNSSSKISNQNENVLPHSQTCSRQLFPYLDNNKVLEQKNRAAAVIQAHIKGYLIRRLLKTERVQGLIQTIKDALICAMELHSENVDNINESDVELHRRLIQQVSAAVYTFYDVFFKTTTSERMTMIRTDRERIKEKLKRPRSKGSISSRSSRSSR